MKVCVLSGSPRGSYSITYQTVLYLQKLYPNCDFDTLNVGSKIRQYEKDFSEAKEKLEKSDIILFCYPVYTFLVPYQLHRFIELMKGIDIAGKCAAQITTSKHFFDVTAHDFVKDNCDDMALHYLGGLSLDMEDLLCKKGQQQTVEFWDMVLWRYDTKTYLPMTTPKSVGEIEYVSNITPVEKKDGKKIVIVSAGGKDDATLNQMISDFKSACAYECEVVSLADFPFKGGCLGCLNCASNGKCVYKDGFDDFLRGNIQSGDAIVYAFKVQDHSMGSLMKLFDDRQFCNGHRTVTMGKPVGYIVQGSLDSEKNLNTVITARADVGGNFLAGVATDCDGIKSLSKTMEYALESGINLPTTFYGIGGTRIFRDLIWLMRGMMKADHKFFKQHGLYDFPQKKRGTLIKMKLVGGLISNPKVKAKMGNMMNEGMIAPYKKVIDKLDKK